MSSVAILKRPKTAVQCSSCKQRFDSTDLLAGHLQKGFNRAVCPKTRAPTLLCCVDCERPFADIDGLTQHFQHSFEHNEELSKPTGRSVYVGRLPYGVTERTVKEVLFAGYVIETTSMLAHLEAKGQFTNFAFVNFSTVEEANRAIKELHGSRLYGSKILVQPQKSSGGSGAVSTGLQRQRFIAKCSATNMEDMTPQSVCKQQAGSPKVKINQNQPIGLRGGAPSFQSAGANSNNNVQPAHPLVTTAQQYGFAPQYTQALVNLPVANSFPQPSQGSFHGYTPPRSPHAYDNPHIYATATQSASYGYHQNPQPGFPPRTYGYDGTQETASVHQQVQLGWPPVTSSGPQPEPRSWTTFSQDQMPAVVQALANHCHSEAELSLAGFNPVKPPRAQMEAKVKCKYCRKARKFIEYKIPTSVKLECPTAPDRKHSFPGISHLTARYKDFLNAPKPTVPSSKCTAIALDCEMAGAHNGDGFLEELIQLTAIDYLTGEVLISTFVEPTTKIRQWRTSIHGVNRQMIEQAVENGTALKGWKAAQAALFEHMNTDTILIGHALHHDLNVLKIAHTRCVDSEMLASAAVGFPNHRQWGLKMLCERLLGLGVQVGANHNCLEDSFSAREAVICMTMRPDALAAWADVQKKRLAELEAQRQVARNEKEAAKVAAAMEAEAGVPFAAGPTVNTSPLSTVAPALAPDSGTKAPHHKSYGSHLVEQAEKKAGLTGAGNKEPLRKRRRAKGKPYQANYYEPNF